MGMALAVAKSELVCLLALLLAFVIAARDFEGSREGLLHYHDVKTRRGYDVSYDNRSFIIDGQRTLLLSGAVHYPRVVAEQWSDVFRQMYLDGLNTVQTYIYWNLHQSERGGEYDFSGNKNWTLFVEKAAEAGLFVTLRIGPFVASEWDYGECQAAAGVFGGLYTTHLLLPLPQVAFLTGSTIFPVW